MLSCVGFFTVLELVAAGLGIQPLYLIRDPWVGFESGVPLFVRDGDVFRTNPVKHAYFNPQTFTAAKSARGFRIFTLGGSTTFGHPYKDPTSFSGWLRQILQRTAPGTDWEVVNCGGISYASYRECLLVQELVRYQPDLFIICTGHNEFLESRTYPDQSQSSALRAACDAALARSRLATLVARGLERRTNRNEPGKTRLAPEVDTILEHSIGPESYHRDAQWQAGVQAHFRHSLNRMAELARGAGARILFVSPAANLRDFTPFKSEHGSVGTQVIGEADRLLARARRAFDAGRIEDAQSDVLAAVALDPQFAQGQWEAGRALFEAKELDAARTHFWKAVDEDICPLRAGSALRDSVRETATAASAGFIDYQELLENDLLRTVGHRIPGNETFLDHVHPSISAHGRLGWALFDQLVEWNLAPQLENREAALAEVASAVEDAVDAGSHASALVQLIQVLSWAGKNAEALSLAERAEQDYPGHADIACYHGRMLEKIGRKEEAFERYAEAVRRDDRNSLALSRLAFAELERGNRDEARARYEQAIAYTPESAPVSFRTDLFIGLGRVQFERQDYRAAISAFESALALSPGSKDARQFLSSAQSHAAVPSGRER